MTARPSKATMATVVKMATDAGSSSRERMDLGTVIARPRMATSNEEHVFPQIATARAARTATANPTQARIASRIGTSNPAPDLTDDEAGEEPAQVGLPGNVPEDKGDGGVDHEEEDELAQHRPPLQRVPPVQSPAQPDAEEPEDRPRGADTDVAEIPQVVGEDPADTGQPGRG